MRGIRDVRFTPKSGPSGEGSDRPPSATTQALPHSARVRNIETIPNTVLGAAWRPQQDRMASATYFPLFLVLMGAGRTDYSIFYLSADLQEPSMFQFINSFAGNVGSRTLRALSTPVTGSLAGSINPICTR